MLDAQRVPQRSVTQLIAAIARTVLVAAALPAAACVPMPHPASNGAVELLLIPALIAAPAGLSANPPDGPMSGRVPLAPHSFTVLDHLRVDVPRNGSWIATHDAIPADSFPYSTRAGVLTFGGPNRESAAVLRVLLADSVGRRAAAADLRRAAPTAMRTLLVAPGAVGPRDIAALVAVIHELAAGARAGGVAEVLVAAAGADTVSYPSRLLASVSDALLITFDPPAPTTPGPPVTVEDLRRIIGLRASEVGRSRLVVLLPAHGFLWPRGSLPRTISFAEGTRLAHEWRTPLRRDAASDALYARSPAHGELWLADGRLVARLAREARMMGIRRFAVVLGAGEDAALPDSLAAGFQTTSSSR
jgi:hypothetical protein